MWFLPLLVHLYDWHGQNPLAGAHTRFLLNVVSDTLYTPNTPYYPLNTP